MGCGLSPESISACRASASARARAMWVSVRAMLPQARSQRSKLGVTAARCVPLGQHRTLVGGGELSSAGAVAFGRGAADVLTVLQPVGGLGEGVGQGAGAF